MSEDYEKAIRRWVRNNWPRLLLLALVLALQAYVYFTLPDCAMECVELKNATAHR